MSDQGPGLGTALLVSAGAMGALALGMYALGRQDSKKYGALQSLKFKRLPVTAFADVSEDVVASVPQVKTEQNAKRMASAIAVDINLYNEHAVEAAQRGDFSHLEPVLWEGWELYRVRVPLEIDPDGHLFEEAIERVLKL
jgi:hypothetical protein